MNIIRCLIFNLTQTLKAKSIYEIYLDFLAYEVQIEGAVASVWQWWHCLVPVYLTPPRGGLLLLITYITTIIAALKNCYPGRYVPLPEQSLDN